MPYVIAEPCIGVKDGSCVSVCPMDCIHGSDQDRQMFIDPSECIDCGLCESHCPAGAIFYDDELPSKWKHFLQVNADHYRN